MELTIYNTYVVMESQEQCDRMKQLCIDNNLPIWEDDCAFAYAHKENVFGYYYGGFSYNVFFVLPYNYHSKHTKVTEQEFINLLNKHNETTKTK